MRSVSTITNWGKGILAMLGIMTTGSLVAQINSPYSRYGLGDMVPGQNIVNRAMGGATAAYYDVQSVNFINPASYARLLYTTVDIGLDFESRRLRESSSVRSLTSSYITPSYLQIGIPIKRGNWGMNIGLRPLSRINYKINNNELKPGIPDSLQYLYEGGGGTYQAYLGTGFGTKNLSVGFNVGYLFGNKEISTKTIFLDDSIQYNKAKYSDTTSYGGVFINGGIQYTIPLAKQLRLKLGAYGQLQNKLKARRDVVRETYEFNPSTGDVPIDSVFASRDQGGDIIFPASYGFGFSLDKEVNWSVHADFSLHQWDDYRYYGERDALRNIWQVRMGGQFIPNIKGKSYWGVVAYRLGVYAGPDYVDVGRKLNRYAVTFGFGFPVGKYGMYRLYSNQTTTINTSFEIGARGNQQNAVRESFYRVSVGLSLSDIWFIKNKYN